MPGRISFPAIFGIRVGPAKHGLLAAARLNVQIRPMTTLVEPGPDDLDALLALSNAHEKEIGCFGRDAFAELVTLSFRTRMTRERDAFLIALAERAPADAPNYRWFAARFERFVYIDRVVVAER